MSNFNPRFKLHNACRTDEGYYPRLQYVHFRNGMAYATNAYVLVRAKVSEISNLRYDQIKLLDGYSIHGDDFKKMLKYEHIYVTEQGTINIELNERSHIEIGMRQITGLPDFDEMLDKRDEVSNEGVCLNPMRLNQLFEAMGADEEDKMLFHFSGGGKPAILGYPQDSDLSIVGCILAKKID